MHDAEEFQAQLVAFDHQHLAERAVRQACQEECSATLIGLDLFQLPDALVALGRLGFIQQMNRSHERLIVGGRHDLGPTMSLPLVMSL